MLAYCGLYCGACSFRLAAQEKNRRHLKSMPAKYDQYKDAPLDEPDVCPGCRLEHKCGECAIRDCAVERSLTHCGRCDDFPCYKVNEFNDDGIPHHGESIKNLKELKIMDQQSWLEQQEKLWTCQCLPPVF